MATVAQAVRANDRAPAAPDYTAPSEIQPTKLARSHRAHTNTNTDNRGGIVIILS